MMTKRKADAEMKQFQDDLLQSVTQMKRGRAARKSAVLVTPASEARARTGLTQAEFSGLLGVSIRTLQDWEQGRRDPTGAAQTLLRVATKRPKILRGLAAA
jgi:putative transcriptional regulator